MRLVCRVAIVALSIGLASAALAETWPDKPIRAFIPFGAGSATDVIPRAVFDALAAELGQPIIVENRGGAGGTLGIGEVVRAQPDGYTILANSSAHAIAPFIVPNFPYDVAKDLSGVLMIGQNANVMLVLPSKGWKTVQDFVAAAKAKPGSMNFGSAGVGTATHICGERLRLAAGIEATHVPYKGGAEALTDLLGGRLDFLFTSDLDRAAAYPRRPRRAPDGLDADARLRSAGRADAARRRLCQRRDHRLVRGLHAGQDAARHRREIPRGRHEGFGDAGDEGQAEATRGRSDADDAGGDRQICRQRTRVQRKADQGRRHQIAGVNRA